MKQSPATPPTMSTQPYTLTFFMTSRDRAGVLRKLRSIHADRTKAILIALDVFENHSPLPPRHQQPRGEHARPDHRY